MSIGLAITVTWGNEKLTMTVLFLIKVLLSNRLMKYLQNLEITHQ